MTSIFGLDINLYLERRKQKIQDKNYLRNFQALQKQFVKKQINGDIHMSMAQIKELGEPINNDNAATKIYVDKEIDNKINNCVTYDQGSIDLEWGNIHNVKLPLKPYDAISRLYLSMFFRQDDTNMDKLLQIARVLKGTIQSRPNHNTAKYFQQFSDCFENCNKLNNYYQLVLIKRDSAKNVRDLFRHCIIFVELKAHIITLIENLDSNIFDAVKEQMQSYELITPNINSGEDNNEFPCKRFRRFINKTFKDIDPTKKTSEMELLVKKNSLIFDLGFVYFIQPLLERLLADISINNVSNVNKDPTNSDEDN